MYTIIEKWKNKINNLFRKKQTNKATTV